MAQAQFNSTDDDHDEQRIQVSELQTIDQPKRESGRLGGTF